MKQKKIRKRLGKAIREQQICRVVLDFAPDREFRFLPVNSSEQLICMIREGDTRSYGYAVFCLEDIKKVVVEDEAVKLRGKDTKQGMKIDLADWPAVFRSLGMRGKAVIVESAVEKEKGKEPEKNTGEEADKKEPDGKDSVFAIGKIEKVGHRQVVIAYYGPDPAWEDKKWKISYDSITHVNTASSYTEVMSQYVPEGAAQLEPLPAGKEGEAGKEPQESGTGSETKPVGLQHLAGRDIEAEWEPLSVGSQGAAGSEPQGTGTGSETKPVGLQHLAGRDIEAEWEPLPTGPEGAAGSEPQEEKFGGEYKRKETTAAAGVSTPVEAGKRAADHSSSIGRLLDTLESLDLSGDRPDKNV